MIRTYQEGVTMEQTQITYRVEGQTLWIILPKELDHHSSRFLKENTEQILKEHYIRRIIFDFTISICSIRIFDHCNIQSIFAFAIPVHRYDFIQEL